MYHPPNQYSEPLSEPRNTSYAVPTPSYPTSNPSCSTRNPSYPTSNPYLTRTPYATSNPYLQPRNQPLNPYAVERLHPQPMQNGAPYPSIYYDDINTDTPRPHSTTDSTSIILCNSFTNFTLSFKIKSSTK